MKSNATSPSLPVFSVFAKTQGCHVFLPKWQWLTQVLLSIRDLSSRRICIESESKVARLWKPFRLKPSTEPWFELCVTQTVEDSSSYSRSGWVTKHCPHRQPIDRLAELARFTEQGQFVRELFPCKKFSSSKVVYKKAYWCAFLVILAARSEISTWRNVLPSTPILIQILIFWMLRNNSDARRCS